MICPSCRTDNIEGADTCANCGQSLTNLDLPEAHLLPPFMQTALGSLPQRTVLRVGPRDPLGLAVRYMQNGNSGAVLVMDGEQLAGIITAWDLLHKLVGISTDLNAQTCASIMTPDPVVFSTEDSLALALNKMSAGDFRHIPVRHDEHLVNLIDVNDVFRQLSPYLV